MMRDHSLLAQAFITTKLCRVKQAAELLGVHQETIRRWIRSGKLKADRINEPDGDYFIKRDDLRAFIEHE